jgi:hypothetical protein
MTKGERYESFKDFVGDLIDGKRVYWNEAVASFETFKYTTLVNLRAEFEREVFFKAE